LRIRKKATDRLEIHSSIKARSKSAALNGLLKIGKDIDPEGAEGDADDLLHTFLNENVSSTGYHNVIRS